MTLPGSLALKAEITREPISSQRLRLRGEAVIGSLSYPTSLADKHNLQGVQE